MYEVEGLEYAKKALFINPIENPLFWFADKKFFIVSSGFAALIDACNEAGLCNSFGGSTTPFLNIANIFFFLIKKTYTNLSELLLERIDYEMFGDLLRVFIEKKKLDKI